MSHLLQQLGLFVGISFICLLPLQAGAGDFQYLEDSEINAENIAAGLALPSSQNQMRGPSLSRGLGDMQTTAPSGPVKCKKFRQTRGIKPIEAAPEPMKRLGFYVQFEVDSDELLPAEQWKLDEAAEAFRSEGLASCCFRIAGHADNTGAADYNQALSERRAQRVAGYLFERHGIETERFMTIGHGEEKPIAGNDTAEGRRKNRRVEFANLGVGDFEAEDQID